MKALDFAQETTKQLITLAAAILTLTITFVSELAGDVAGWPKYVLGSTWIFNILSILGGLAALGALTAELEPKEKSSSESTHPGPSIRAPDVLRASRAQGAFFALGMTSLVTFGIATY